MPLGITPARGPWIYRRSAISSLAQSFFVKGDLVAIGHDRTVSVYTSTYSGYFGVGTQASVNSLPAGFCTIAIPLPGATAYVDVATSEVASSLSIGQVGSIATAGGQTSTLSLIGTASGFSRHVSIQGPLDSATSRIEVAFLFAQAEYGGSTSTLTLNN